MATPERADSTENVSAQEKEEFEKKRHHVEDEEHVDYYEMLGLGEERWDATPEQIKKAYRKVHIFAFSSFSFYFFFSHKVFFFFLDGFEVSS